MILIVTQTFAPATGGMEVYMTTLAEELARAGREVVVFADGKDKNYAPQANYILRRFSGWRPYRRWRKRRAVAELFDSRVIEGVFCDSWKSVEALPETFSAPIVVLAHGAEYPVTPSRRKGNRIITALEQSTKILANSRFTADVVRPYLARSDDPRLIVVHPPISPLLNPSPEAHEKMRKKIGERFPVISVLSRLEPRKGIDRIITAMPAVIAKYPSVVFLIGGSGDDEWRLRDLVKEKGVAKNVVFLGAVSNERKLALLANSDVFAMPVRRVGTSVEGFGISYIEAAWFGVPSLGGAGCGAEDAVIDGKTGLICDGENQTEVTIKLLKLLDDETLRRKLGQAAKKRAQQELIWSKALPRFIAALQKPNPRIR
ncbi:MAG: glycosyltransferase family 4 protein [Bdellovibrionales bacterium]|jgi:phosphatidylinositol alpha-1,6-mannosyltransferase